MTQEITNKEESRSIAIVPENADGIGEGIGVGDINMSRITIVQPTSQLSGAAGKLFDTSTDEEMDEMNVVFLAVKKSRVMWARDEQGRTILGEDPVCKSKNGTTGEGDPGGICADCPHSKWGGNRQRPACDNKYDFMGVNMDTLTPFFLTIGGASYNAGKKIITKSVRGNRPLYSFNVNIKPELVQSSAGKYYKYNLSIGEDVDEKTMADLKTMKEDFASQMNRSDDVQADNGEELTAEDVEM